MPRSSRPTSSKRRASRAPRESLLDAQTTVDSDVEDHQRDRLHFSLDHSVTLMLPGDRAAWNPPENAVAIYGAILSYGVTLPLHRHNSLQTATGY
ncbi:hypothetical protein LWI29_016131 [Acer saccharum]|uniref:Uncharacterized protein n=1 Tax=Acer saccharum TaxID=4024 RepID=A0AA39VRW2_ACESA|nr:hypothetical protein LWI29_016131 [Acer saccharum]